MLFYDTMSYTQKEVLKKQFENEFLNSKNLRSSQYYMVSYSIRIKTNKWKQIVEMTGGSNSLESCHQRQSGKLLYPAMD